MNSRVFVALASLAVASCATTAVVRPAAVECEGVPASVAWFAGDGDAIDRVSRQPAIVRGAVSFVPGVRGQAMSFGAQGSLVEVPHINALAGARATMSAWVYMPAANSDQVWIVGQNFRTQMVVSNTQRATVHFNGDDGEFHSVSDTIAMPLRTWVHLTGVLSATGSQTTLQLYRDGVLVGNETFAHGLAADRGCGTWIGGVRDGAEGCAYDGQYFVGQIDDVRVFDRALSGQEVAALARCR